MKHFKSALAVGLVMLFSTAGMAFGQGNGSQGPPKLGCQARFDALDTNHDGKLTKEEFMAFPHRRNNAEQVFDTMDVNGQGYITKEEFCAGKGMGRGMGRCQGNGSQGPPKLGCQRRFDALDTNHDGKLTKEEFIAFPHRRNNAEQVFDTMDVNGQGYITKEEFCAGKGMGRGMGRCQGSGTNQ